MPKQATKANVVTSAEDKSVVWTFIDGERHAVMLASIPAEVQTMLTLHGLSQKGSDCYSGVSTLAEVKAKHHAVIKALQSGQWRVTGGKASIDVEVIAELRGVSIEEAIERWGALADEDKKKVRKHPQFIQIKATIVAARELAKTGDEEVDLDSLLGEEDDES